MNEIPDFSDLIWYSVDKLKNMCELNGLFEILVSWKGLSTNGYSWEPFETMYKDVLTKLCAYFNRRRKTDIMKRAMKSLGI